MKNTKIKYNDYEYSIAAHFLTALLYGDESGLNSEDKEQLTEFLSQFDGQVDVYTSDDESNFGRCDVCHLGADVMECTVRVFKNIKTKSIK